MPTSYQGPMRRDKTKPDTRSQTRSSNVKPEITKVGHLLEHKGGSVFTISQNDTLGRAVEILRDKRIGALVVTDQTGTLCGILSERDIVRKLAETPGQTLPKKVNEIMTRDVVTCGPDDTLVSVLQRMTQGRFRHMPVVDGATLAGVVTIGDVIGQRLNELEHEALQLKQLIVG